MQLLIQFGDVQVPDTFPERVATYPQLRFMGSKHRLLPWIHQTLHNLDFDTALDGFSGSGCVGYLLASEEKGGAVATVSLAPSYVPTDSRDSSNRRW
jgi:DNA adenine methylase/adenine-specific DNA-methyltransferase